jgi:hypothetical protein
MKTDLSHLRAKVEHLGEKGAVSSIFFEDGWQELVFQSIVVEQK